MLCAALFVWSSLTLPDNPNPWQHVRADPTVNVWAREVPQSPIREVKAETIVEADIDRVWDVLADVDSYAQFMPYLVEARTLAEQGESGVHLEYQRVNPPWVSQRDYIIRIETAQDRPKGEYVRRWSAESAGGPAPRQDSIRLQVCDGSWTLQRLDERKTKVTYWVYTDPAGSIPGWVANRANTRSVPDVLAAVRNRAQVPTWTR